MPAGGATIAVMDTSSALAAQQLGSSFANQIVVGVDGSAASIAALRYATRLATALALPITAVLAWTPPPMLPPHGSRPPSSSKAAARTLVDAVGLAYGTALPPGLRTEALRGPAARTLVEISDECAVLVVGSRGGGGFAGLLLGSVALACTTHARCPVLVMHPGPG